MWSEGGLDARDRFMLSRIGCLSDWTMGNEIGSKYPKTINVSSGCRPSEQQRKTLASSNEERETSETGFPIMDTMEKLADLNNIFEKNTNSIDSKDSPISKIGRYLL